MLKEGKSGRVSTYVVRGIRKTDPVWQTVITDSTQKAVDHVRKIDPDFEVIEVWKVVSNWK